MPSRYWRTIQLDSRDASRRARGNRKLQCTWVGVPISLAVLAAAVVATIPRQLNRDEMPRRPHRLTAAIILDTASRRVFCAPVRMILWKTRNHGWRTPLVPTSVRPVPWNRISLVASDFSSRHFFTRRSIDDVLCTPFRPVRCRIF